MKTKQKSVTMWVIWSPYCKGVRLDTLAKTRQQSFDKIYKWLEGMFLYDSLIHKKGKKRVMKGYRAVRGKFIWEEKC